jgi:PEP-CTERM motif
MRIRTLLMAAAAAAAFAAPASAAITISLTSQNAPLALQPGEQLVADFNVAATPDAVLLPGFDLDLVGATVGFKEGVSGYSGTLPGNATHYLTIPGNASAKLTSLAGLKTFSFYMGSADTYNSIRFKGDNGFDVTLNGGQFTQGYVGQSWSWGKRVNFDFGNDRVTEVILSSTGNSFEVDSFAVTAVPEPATWAMMIMGFGVAGALLRRRQVALARA